MTDRSDNDHQAGDDLDYLDATFPDHGDSTEASGTHATLDPCDDWY